MHFPHIKASLDTTTTIDAPARTIKVLESCTTPLLDFILSSSSASEEQKVYDISQISPLHQHLAQEASLLLHQTRSDYLSGKMGRAPASALLGNARSLYEFVREELGVGMHGQENLDMFEGEREMGVGEGVSEAVKDGRIVGVVTDLIKGLMKEEGWRGDTVHSRREHL
jgi:phenylalanine ammonia-lyase